MFPTNMPIELGQRKNLADGSQSHQRWAKSCGE
jgi:hypothetical protein